MVSAIIAIIIAVCPGGSLLPGLHFARVSRLKAVGARRACTPATSFQQHGESEREKENKRGRGARRFQAPPYYR